MKILLTFLSLSWLVLPNSQPSFVSSQTTTITTKISQEKPISSPNASASTPRFTTDNQGNVVLSWVEKEGEVNRFYFAISKDGGNSFSEKILIPTPEGVSTHAEGMPKIAFKNDGTIVTLMEAKRATPDAPRAAFVYYGMSSDGGKTWAKLRTIHQDTTLGKGRSFSDLMRLPNGEVGAAWLDVNIKTEGDGRSVRFAQTSPNAGFGKDLIVDGNACQCCRMNLFADSKGNIHLTFRDLLPDGSRDMGHVMSADGGKTFSSTETVYADKWIFNACPHTGPATAELNNQLYMAWYSGKPKSEGVRVAQLDKHELVFKLEKTSFHPQMTTWNKNLALLWEEFVESENGESYRKIGLMTWQPKGKSNTIFLSENKSMATYPTAIATQKGLLVAYELKKGEEKTQIVYRVVSE